MSAHPAAVERRCTCPNCGAALGLADGRLAHYCPDCGQETDPRPPTVVELFRQLISHYAAAEGRLWPTLRGLVAKPGFLTTEYFAGRRRRYIIPTRLYLTTSILFFIVVKVLGAGNLAHIDESPKKSGTVQPAPASRTIQPGETRVPPQIPNAVDLAGNAPDQTRKDAAPVFPQASTTSGTRLPANIRIGAGSSTGMNAPFLNIIECETFATPCTKLRDWLATKYGNITVREFSLRIKERMISLAPYALFLMLPVFAAITWLLYWRRRLYYSEHLVYALHVHSFAFLLLLGISLGPKAAGDILWFVGMVYFWLAMRRVFGGRWWMTTLRYAMLGVTYPVLLSFSIVLTLIFAILV